MEEHYYHMFANGDDAKDFITTESEFVSAFNRFAVCTLFSKAAVVSASVEDSHPHALIWGTYRQCLIFAQSYESLSIKSIAKRRGTAMGVNLHCELYEVDDDLYLKNVAAYTIVQATKDGKRVMPYDYRYGTGALYFRSKYSVLPWLIDNNGNYCKPSKYSDLTVDKRRIICGTRKIELPDDWLICNDFILPTNYVDLERFESIFKTHNCFRAFLSAGKAQDDPIFSKMAEARGVTIEDIEARQICKDVCRQLFNMESTRNLSTEQRLCLARQIRRVYHLSFRQLSFLTKVPEIELRKYVR